jgi:CubicO group peptidase (beta-lactamase class C family)
MTLAQIRWYGWGTLTWVVLFAGRAGTDDDRGTLFTYDQQANYLKGNQQQRYVAMKMLHPLIGAASLMLLCAPCFGQADDPHIAAIAANLSPNMVKEGELVHGKSLAEAMAEYHVPGVSIAYISHGKIAWVRSFGVLGIGGEPVTPDTLFQAGSISKPMTATAALHLVQQGKLSLDADVNTSLVRWKLPTSEKAEGKPVTLRELLSHTAGTNVHGFPGYAAGTPVPTTLQILDGAPPATNPPIRVENTPGKQWNYSGGGYVIIQQMITDTAQKPFAELLGEVVLKPYGPRIVHTVPVDSAILKHYVGTYKMNPWFSFAVTLRNGKLLIQGTHQPNLEFWPESNTRFTFVVDVDVEFVRDTNGDVTGMNVLQDGKMIFARKQ